MDDLHEMIPEAEENDESLMVLTACNYMLHPLVGELRRQGIRFHNPFRRKHGGWNPLRVGGKNLTAADRLIRFMSLSTESDPATITAISSTAWGEPSAAL